jgi:hypothetical protein
MGSKKQTIGYAYFLDFSYALCEELDEIIGFYLNETKMWSGTVSSNGATIRAQTGLTSEVGGSGNGPSTFINYFGDQTSPDSYMESKTGLDLIYKNVAYTVFPQVFIGDNVRSIPQYGFLVKRINIESASSLPNYSSYYDIVGTKHVITSVNEDGEEINYTYNNSGTAVVSSLLQTVINLFSEQAQENYDVKVLEIHNANPAYILYDILVTLLRVNKSKIDEDSFTYAAEVLYNEKLGLNILITSAKPIKDWIQEILRYVTGVLYYNYTTDKYVFKLFRADYTIDDLPLVTVDMTSNIKFSRGTRADLPNTFVFKYSNITSTSVPKSDTLTLSNPAALDVSGFIKSQEIDLSMINTEEAFSQVANLYFTKMSNPLAEISFKISPIDLPDYTLGSTFLFNDTYLTGDSEIVFRVTKITGDAVRDSSLTIEAIEDIFSFSQAIEWTPNVTLTMSTQYELNSVPNRVKAFPCTPENTTTKGVHLAATYPGVSSAVRNMVGYEVTEDTMQFEEWKYATVTNIETLDNGEVDRSVVLTVENTDGDFYNIAGTDSDLQRLVYAAYWGDEAIGFQTMTEVSDNTFEITGIVRGIQNDRTTHTVGEAFWLCPIAPNELPVVSFYSLTPTFHVYAENQFTQSEETTVNYTYNGEIDTPYTVNSLRCVAGELIWSPCVRLSGANYRNCDTILSGQDEGNVEGIFNVYKNSTLLGTVTPSNYETFITYPITSVGTYLIKTKLGSYESQGTSVVVTPADLQEKVTVSYRYIKWEITGKVSNSTVYCQISEFKLLLDNNDILMTGSIATSTNTYIAGESPDKLVDGSLTTKVNFNQLPTVSVVMDMSVPVSFNGYNWATGNDTATNTSRNPDDWNLYGSNDGVNWTLLHTVSNAAATTANLTWTGPYPVTL